MGGRALGRRRRRAQVPVVSAGILLACFLAAVVASFVATLELGLPA